MLFGENPLKYVNCCKALLIKIIYLPQLPSDSVVDTPKTQVDYALSA